MTPVFPGSTRRVQFSASVQPHSGWTERSSSVAAPSLVKTNSHFALPLAMTLPKSCTSSANRIFGAAFAGVDAPWPKAAAVKTKSQSPDSHVRKLALPAALQWSIDLFISKSFPLRFHRDGPLVGFLLRFLELLQSRIEAVQDRPGVGVLLRRVDGLFLGLDRAAEFVRPEINLRHRDPGK